ncbi:MAG: PD40 domain-containing protein [Anaerolineales bacterium]|nr:PD40 domain-containing protein [Anaerolineales bacterium]
MNESWKNPYVAGSPIRGEEMFFGRDEVFRWLRDHLMGQFQDNVIVLYGERRTGKTSILYQIPRRLGDASYLPVFIDLQQLSLDSMSSFWWQVAIKISSELRKVEGIAPINRPERPNFADAPGVYFAEVFLSQIQETIGQQRRLLLMFDEFERMRTKVKAGEFPADVFDYLRSLMADHRLSIIVSLGSKLEEMESEYSVLFNQAIYHKITFLNEADARVLITQPVAQYYSYPNEAIDFILKAASGHPFYTQHICHAIFARREMGNVALVGVEEVRQVLPDVVEATAQNLKFTWDDVGAAEKVVIAALATQNSEVGHAVSRTTLVRLLQTGEVCPPAGELTTALQTLRTRDILREEKSGEYAFTIEPFRLWLSKERRLDFVREDLAKEGVIERWQSSAPSVPAKSWWRQPTWVMLAVMLLVIIGLGVVLLQKVQEQKSVAATATAFAKLLPGELIAARGTADAAANDLIRLNDTATAVVLTKTAEKELAVDMATVATIAFATPTSMATIPQEQENVTATAEAKVAATAIAVAVQASATAAAGVVANLEATAAAAAVPTPTPALLVATIINPALGATVTTELVFQVQAYDPGVGSTDGAGIDLVEMRIVDSKGTLVYERTEKNAAYCAFGGGEPTCLVWVFADHNNTWPNGSPVENGTYTLQAAVQAKDGRSIEVQTIIEIQLPTPTPAPTPTLTRTSTPKLLVLFPPSHQILFTSNRSSTADLYVMNGDGSGLTQITTNVAYEPDFSRDGKRIIFTSGTETPPRTHVCLYIVPLNSPEELLDSLFLEKAYNIGGCNFWDNWEGVLSPGGQQIAFVSSRENQGWEIYTMNIDGSDLKRLTQNLNEPGKGSVKFWGQAWSPAGQHIAFVVQQEGRTEYDGPSDVWVMDTNATKFDQLTDKGPINIRPAWSPDGQQIVFASNRDGNFEIYVMDANGTNERRLTNSPFDENFPVWSPDGNWLAYVRFTTNNHDDGDIFVMTTDGNCPITDCNVTKNGANDWDPIWVP